MRSASRPGHARTIPTSVLLVLFALVRPTFAQEAPPDSSWEANADVLKSKVLTDLELGAVQGIVVRDGKIYAYGDLVTASPRIGVIREYDLDLKFTGRSVRLSKGGVPLILHPTGLTWDDRLGTFLGDTVKKKAIIYKFDWERAWADGNLDRAVVATMEDDASINGCRPLFVQVKGRTLLATADYGDVRPELRLYDPEALLAAGRSSALASLSIASFVGRSIRICIGMPPLAISLACRT